MTQEDRQRITNPCQKVSKRLLCVKQGFSTLIALLRRLYEQPWSKKMPSDTVETEKGGGRQDHLQEEDKQIRDKIKAIIDRFP
ncbi:hypothetical protein Pmani_001154 [Petrolisthes manimaculis]|uniref:Uncharacterized protein n=1 Tax=Petrolisthes manimaculis TaxID=1843537 RepID=A0AAE1QL15_9EUCA|nr:hypothetical protein Pmani_001154 [Petrolisthes manimaculis]